MKIKNIRILKRFDEIEIYFYSGAIIMNTIALLPFFKGVLLDHDTFSIWCLLFGFLFGASGLFLSKYRIKV